MMWFTAFITHFLSYWAACIPFGKVDRHVASVCLLNQFAITLPLSYLLNDAMESSVSSSEQDTLGTSLYKVVLISYLSNLCFYWVHRLLHSRLLFRYVHHIHHRFRNPVASTALYAHPIEHLFANTLCFTLPALWIGLSYYWMLGLLSFGTVNIVLAHTAYGKSHQIHHRRFYYNYGFGDYLDWCNGTYLSLDEV